MDINLNKAISLLNEKKLAICMDRNTIYRFALYKKRKLPWILEKLYNLWKDPRVKFQGLYKVVNSTDGEFINRVCFGYFLGRLQDCRPDAAVIEVFINTQLIRKRSPFNNFTWLSKKQIQEHMNYLQDVIGLDFYFEVKDSKINLGNGCDNVEGISVKINFKSLKYIEIKYVLFWLRYTYEFPGNIVLIDTYLLKKRYPEEELYNIFLLPSRLLSVTSRPLPMDQTISVFGRFVNLGRLKNCLKRYNNVTDIYGQCCESYINPLNNINLKYFSELFKTIYVNYSSWLEYEERWKIYDEMLSIYKNNIIEEDFKTEDDEYGD